MLNQKSKKSVYFSFIHSYINYGSIAWGSKYKTKLKKIFTYQKKTARVIFFCMPNHWFLTWTHSIYQNLILLYKAHKGRIPSTFFNKFSKINHNYLTSSKNSGNYTILKSTMKLTNFAISRRGPILWNTVLDALLKQTESLPLFKAKVKEVLLSRDNELSFY